MICCFFSSSSSQIFGKKGGFQTKYISEIETDPTREEFTHGHAALKELGLRQGTDYGTFDLRALRCV